jgi:hypothetical protein
MSPRHPDESSVTPHGETTFEHVVRRLHLSPSEYATSARLKEGARKNKDSKFVTWAFFIFAECVGSGGAFGWLRKFVKKFDFHLEAPEFQELGWLGRGPFAGTQGLIGELASGSWSVPCGFKY